MTNINVAIWSELVKTLDLEPVPLGQGDSVQFRVEIHKRLGDRVTFEAQMWRIEHYRLQPTFPQMGQAPTHQPSDERVVVRDDSFVENLVSESIDGAVQVALDAVREKCS